MFFDSHPSITGHCDLRSKNGCDHYGNYFCCLKSLFVIYIACYDFTHKKIPRNAKPLAKLVLDLRSEN